MYLVLLTVSVLVGGGCVCESYSESFYCTGTEVLAATLWPPWGTDALVCGLLSWWFYLQYETNLINAIYLYLDNAYASNYGGNNVN